MNILEENDSFIFWEENDIICFAYKKPVLDLETAKIGVDIKYKISDDRSRLVYCDIVNIKKVTREARVFYTSNESEELITATAIHTPSPLAKVLVTFFLSFNKPKTPLRFFCNKEKAFSWLNKFQVENN